MEGADLLSVFDKECLISVSQEHTLSHSHFARQDAFPLPSPAAGDWPQFSDDDHISDDNNNVVGITICSPPETPDPPHQNDDKDGTSTTPHPEHFKTPPEVPAPASASSDDVVSTAKSNGGDSPVLGFMDVDGKGEESSEISPEAKKLKDSVDLGFKDMKRRREESSEISPVAKKLKDYVDLGFKDMKRRRGESLEISAMVKKLKDSDDLGFAKESPEISSEAKKLKDSDDLGFTKESSKISPEAKKLKDSDDLGCTDLKKRREESWKISPPAKKLMDSDGLGFPEDDEGTVVLESDDDNQIREKGGNTEVMNDVNDDTVTSSNSGDIETDKEKLELRAEMNINGKLKMKLNLEANVNSKEEYGMNLLNALRNIVRVNIDEKKDEDCDIFETAKRRGLIFPRSRWYDN